MGESFETDVAMHYQLVLLTFSGYWVHFQGKQLCGLQFWLPPERALKGGQSGRPGSKSWFFG